MSELNNILLVDVGNTRIKYMRGYDSQIHYARDLNSLPYNEFDEVRIATVSRTKEIEAWAQSIPTRVQIAKVRKQHRGLSVVYEDISRLGVDRWLAMLSLWVERGQAFGVVDLGTAITADFVDSSGNHSGGYIVPGYRLMKQSLGKNTDQVGFGGNSSEQKLGLNTEECVDHGINRLVFSFLTNLRREEGDGNAFVLTGGDAEKALRAGSVPCAEIDESLVIRGLRYCFE